MKMKGTDMKAMIATLALVCCSAHAEFRDGNKLLSEIVSDNYQANSLALGYIMGVADVGYGATHCAPGSVTSGQMRDMVRNWLTDNPQYRHFMGDVIVAGVLRNTWPCAKKEKGNGA